LLANRNSFTQTPNVSKAFLLTQKITKVICIEEYRGYCYSFEYI